MSYVLNLYLLPVGNIAEMYFEYRINKNALLQTALLAILPTGLVHTMCNINTYHLNNIADGMPQGHN